jgi:toxin ParE1/3/4
MSEFRFSPLAVQDLEDIVAFVARDKPSAAAELVARLRRTCGTLASFPEMGAKRDDLLPGLRVFFAGAYAIYYQAAPDGIRVERVLHSARHPNAFHD